MVEKTRRILPKGHEEDNRLVRDALTLLQRNGVNPILIGGHAVKLYINNKRTKGNTANVAKVSKDIDVVMSQTELTALSESLKERPHYGSLIARFSMSDSNSRRNGNTELPFTIAYMEKLNGIDIFTEATGIGPIRLQAQSLANYETISFCGMEARLAERELIVATNINPMAVTKQRLRKAALLMFDTAAERGYDYIECYFMPNVMVYLLDGSAVVSQKKLEISSGNGRKATFMHALKLPEFARYEHYLHATLPNIIESRAHALLQIARKAQIGDDETNGRIINLLTKKLRA